MMVGQGALSLPRKKLMKKVNGFISSAIDPIKTKFCGMEDQHLLVVASR